MNAFDYISEQITIQLSPEGLKGYTQFLLLSALMFYPLEHFFRTNQQAKFRKEWHIDLLFFTGQFFIFNAISIGCLLWLAQLINAANLQYFQTQIALQPYWLQLFEIVFLCDISIYWAHRLSHRYQCLWRFHQIHHTAERLDWLAAYREHPLDNIYTRVIENLPALLLGFPMETIAGFVVFRGLWGLFIHSNVNITMGPLAYLIGSPRLHHWHHDKHLNEGCNFANLSPLMDLMFGTYYDPGEEPKEYGIREEVNRGYLAQIIQPCIPKLLWLALFSSSSPKEQDIHSEIE